jgi:hypothetical protein
VEEFVRVAKRLQRAKKSLEALAGSPAADRFANRLLAEALSGQAHAAACLGLVVRTLSIEDTVIAPQQRVRIKRLHQIGELEAFDRPCLGGDCLVGNSSMHEDKVRPTANDQKHGFPPPPVATRKSLPAPAWTVQYKEYIVGL